MPDVPSTDQKVPATSLDVRERLVEALNLDLIGPGAGHDLASERLPGWVRPSNWYLTGFLIPAGAPPEHSGDTEKVRVHELQDDYPWVSRVLGPLRGMVVPCEAGDIAERWRREGVVEGLAREVVEEGGEIASASYRQGCCGYP